MARRGQTPRVQALLKAGAQVDAPDENGRTALMLAALQGYWQTMVVLLDAGANAAATDRGGKTAQTLADESGHKEIAQLLAIDPTERRRWEKEDHAALKAYRENRYAEAETAWRAAIERARNFGTGHFLLAASLNNLAELYRARGRYAEAEPLYRQAMTIYEKALGPEHLEVATTANNLAGLYQNLKQPGGAERLYRRALTIYEKALGPEHPEVANTLKNLAGFYQEQARFAEAEPLYRRALAIYEKALGPEHAEVAITLNNLAGLYQEQGSYAKAEPLFERALAISQKALGADHPDSAKIMGNYALLLRKTGRNALADKLTDRASMASIGLLEDPKRDEYQNPDQVVGALKLGAGESIADIGAGSGYFAVRFAPLLGKTGRVYAVDINQPVLRYLKERARKLGLENVVTVLAQPDDPLLPSSSIDRFFICDTWHHIHDQSKYLALMKKMLKPGGQVIMIDYHRRELPVGPPLEEKIDRGALVKQMEGAGFRLIEEHTFLPYQYFLVFVVR